MIEAPIDGEHDPNTLADLARGRLRVKQAALVQALTGRFDEHHADLARVLLSQIDALSAQIDHLSTRIEAMIAAIPAAQGVDSDGTTGPDAGNGRDSAVLPAIARLDQIPGIGTSAAQIIIAEIGLDMTQFSTTTASIPAGRNATISANSKPSATRSPSNPPPNSNHRPHPPTRSLTAIFR